MRNASMRGANRLKLSVFTVNADSGEAAPGAGTLGGLVGHNQRPTRMLDDAGIEFMLPVARWNGYGGITQFQRSALETIT